MGEGESERDIVAESKGRNAMTNQVRVAKMTLGEAIGILRRRANLSQTQLAEKASISRQEISLLECDKTDYKMSTLRAVADALGMRIDLYMFDKDGREVTH